MTKKIMKDQLASFEYSLFCERSYKWTIFIDQSTGDIEITAGCRHWKSFKQAFDHYKLANYKFIHEYDSPFDTRYYESIRKRAINRLKGFQQLIKYVTGKKPR